MSTIDDNKSPPSLEFFLSRLKLLSESLKMSGVDPESISVLKRSNRSGYKTKGKLPSFSALQALALDFDVSMDWFLTGQGPMFRSQLSGQDNAELERIRVENAALKDELLEVNRQYRAAAEKLLHLSGSPEPSFPARADDGEGEGSVPGEVSGRFYERENQDKNGG